jgi:hypothetical protein
MVMFLKCDTTEVGTGKEWFEVEVFVISAICILKQFEFGFCVQPAKWILYMFRVVFWDILPHP